MIASWTDSGNVQNAYDIVKDLEVVAVSINLKSDIIYKVGDAAIEFDLWKYV